MKAPVAEFDPLIPADWMISFQTPTQSSNPTANTQKTPKPNPLLIETLNTPTSPNSLPKFNQKDIDKITAQLTENFEKEFELAQLEINELSSKINTLRNDNSKLKETMQAWENAMNGMISDKHAIEGKHAQEIEKLRLQMEKGETERDRLGKEIEAVTRKYKQVRIDFEDLKEEHEKLKNDNSDLKTQLISVQEAYEKLKNHAQEKINEANKEINRQRESYEKEVSMLKAKLTRAELQVQSLERTVQGKTQENEELTKICDDLLAKIEGS